MSLWVQRLHYSQKVFKFFFTHKKLKKPPQKVAYSWEAFFLCSPNCPKYISFASYEQPIWISNICNKFLLTYFVSKYWQDKSFKSRLKTLKNASISHSLHTQKNKNTLQHLKLGKLKFGIRKIGCSMSWTT